MKQITVATDFWRPVDFDVKVLRPQKARAPDDTMARVRFGADYSERMARICLPWILISTP